MSSNYTIYEVEEPSNSFLRPDSMIGNVDGFIRGLLETPGREARPVYNNLVIICSFLNLYSDYSPIFFLFFKISNIVISTKLVNTTGFDLLSYDIQRGRDVGLPPYTKLRTICGLSEVKSFDDLSDLIPMEVSIFYA